MSKTMNVRRQHSKLRRKKNRRSSSLSRPLRAESLENRMLLAGDFHNAWMPLDVNYDNNVSPSDALAVVNDLNTAGNRRLGQSAEAEGGGPLPFAVDTNGDGSASPQDVLGIINYLNSEGENGPLVRYTLRTFELTKLNVSGTIDDGLEGATLTITDFNNNEVLYELNDNSVDPGLFEPGAREVPFESGDDGTASTPEQLASSIAAAINSANGASVTTAEATVSGAQVTLTNEFSVAVDRFLRGNVSIAANEISTAGLGQEFLVKAFAEDIRMNPEGVFSGYIDFRYDSSLASVVVNDFSQRDVSDDITKATSILHNQDSYGNAPDGDVSTPGVVDGAGSFSGSTSPLGDGEFLLFVTKFQADAQGTVTFTGEPTTDSPTIDPGDEGQSPNLDTGLFGSNIPVCPSEADNGCMGEMVFISASIDIVSEVAAIDDTASLDEDTTVNIVVLDDDIINNPPGGSPVLESFTNPSNGTVTREADDTFTYDPNDDFFGEDTFTYTISNGQGITDSATVTITINPVNDAPVNTVPGGQTIDEDNSLSLTTISVADVDDILGDVSLDVSISASNGDLAATSVGGAQVGNNNSGNLTISGTLADVNSTLGSLVYTPDANFNGGDTLTITSDDGGDVGGGALSDTDTVSITINPINDAPVIVAPASATVFFTDTLEFSGANNNEITVSDAEDSALTLSISIDQGGIFSVGSMPTGVTVTGDGSTSLTLAGSGSGITSALAGSIFDPDDSFIGDATLSLSLSDGELTTPDTIVIAVVPPTKPFAATDRFNVDEDTSLIFTDTDILDNDLFTDDVTDMILTFSDQSLQGGSLTRTDSTFTFTPDTNFFGTLSFSYTIDQLPNTGQDYNGPSTGSINITVDPVNDDPVLVIPGAQTFNEDTIHDFADGISVSDPDGDVDVLLTLSVSSGVLNATLDGSTIENNGSGGVTISGTVSQVNNALNGLTYSPNLNFAGTDSLSVTVNDMGNIGGGELTDSGSVTLNVIAQNDAPEVSVPDLSGELFITDTDNTISGITVSDVDAGDADIEVRVTVSQGALSASSSNGLSVSGSGSTTLTLTGSQTEIQSALDGGLTYSTSQEDASVDLTVRADDLGNTGEGAGITSVSTTFEVVNFVPSTIGGAVFIDGDGDLELDSGERTIGEVTINLVGEDFRGNSVSRTAVTLGNGTFTFNDVVPGSYTLSQVQPAFIIDGPESFSSPVTAAGNDQATIEIGIRGGVDSTDNFFTERGLEARFFDGIDLTTPAQPGGPLYNGLLFALNGDSSWAMPLGDDWSGFESASIDLAEDELSATITVVDMAGNTRSTTVHHDSARLRIRRDGDDVVVRVIGTRSELFGANGDTEGEGDDLASNDAQAYADGVDQVMAAIA